MVKRFYSIFFVLFIVVCFAGCENNQPKEDYYESTGFVMDTVFIQRLYGGQRAEAARAGEAHLHQLENQLSLYLEDSLVGQINEQAGIAPVVITDDAVFAMLSQGRTYSTYAPEVFNITAGPLIALWQIGKEGFRVPEAGDILQTKNLINIDDFILDETNKTAYLQQEGESLDLGGIAKGMACETLKQIYAEHGITQGIISLGGNLILLDGKPDGSDFEAGIRNPFGSSSQYFAVYSGRNVVISTSGGYERYSAQEGKDYSHILDLRTGRPVENELVGVTVICGDGAMSDYLSTYVYIQGLEEGKRLLSDSRFGLIFVDKEKNVYISPHIQNQVKITDKDFSLQTDFAAGQKDGEEAVAP